MAAFPDRFGHPFEHQLFDTQKPAALYVFAPDGAKTVLVAKLEKTATDGGEDQASQR